MLLLLRFFYVFYVFFKIHIVVTFYVFWPCFVRFLEQWACEFKVNVYLTFGISLTCHGNAPQYLAATLHLTSDTDRLRSGSTSTLFVPATRRSSFGDRAFPVAAALLWNTLPVSLRTVSSYLTFRRELKTFIFNISFPDNWTVCVTL